MRVQSLFVDVERGIIMDKEAQDHELTETSTLESGRETSDARGSSKNRQHSKSVSEKVEETKIMV